MNKDTKESIYFYLGNYYLLVNSVMWGNFINIDKKMGIIISDGIGVMEEAKAMGLEKRWGLPTKEAKERFEAYKKRCPSNLTQEAKEQMLKIAQKDIVNILSAMKPLDEDLVLFRNVEKKFAKSESAKEIDLLGLNSCSLNLHKPENEQYGSVDCVIYKIIVPKGTPALRLDKMPELRNEEDEVILPPIKCEVIEKQEDITTLKVLEPLNK